MKGDRKVITVSIEKVLLGIVDKDSLKRVLGSRSSFLNQLIRQHYNFPNSVETWKYFDNEIKENKRIRDEWIKKIGDSFEKNQKEEKK